MNVDINTSAYVIEKTREEVIKVCEYFLAKGEIKSYNEPIKFVSHKGRGKGANIKYYKWKSEVVE